MGPLPMIRMLARSSRRGMRVLSRSGHELCELVEEIRGVVWAGPGLGVVLDAERGRVEHAETLDNAVVEVDVREGCAAERVEVDGVVVVLARDLDLAGGLVAHGMVGAVVAEAELEGAGAEREPEDLVAEADAEDRDLAE